MNKITSDKVFYPIILVAYMLENALYVDILEFSN